MRRPSSSILKKSLQISASTSDSQELGVVILTLRSQRTSVISALNMRGINITQRSQRYAENAEKYVQINQYPKGVFC